MELYSFSRYAVPYAILQGCDVLITLYGISLGVVGEANPIYQRIGLTGFIGLKILVVPILLYLAHTAWIARPSWVRTGFHVSAALLLLVVLNNAVHIGLGLAWA